MGLPRAALIIVLLLGPAGHAAAAVPVDLELLLGVDVSGSIDDEEAKLQRDGYIAAFRHPMIADAIRSGFLGRIAVSYYEWAGFGHMKIIAGWTLIEDRESALAFAGKLTEVAPETARRTAISEAIGFAVGSFDENDFTGKRRVVDISGDGPNNWGPLVTTARDRAVAAGITINGLPIINDRLSPFGWPTITNLDLYYRDCVIGGRGAFMVVANTFNDFAAAVLKKLVLEIAGLQPDYGDVRVAARPSLARPVAFRKPPPCDIGERRWEDNDDL